jgi:methyl-accepting chemotaxis protein
MKRLSLQKKLWFSFGSLLAILLMVGGIGYKTALTTDSLVHTVQFNVHKQNLSAAIELAVEKEKVGGRDALLHDDAKYLNDARADFDQQMAALQPLLTSATSHQLFTQTQESEAAYRRFVDQAIQMHKSGDSARALEAFYGSAAQQARADLKKSTVGLVDWYGKLAADAETEQLRSSASASVLTLILTCLGLLLGSVVAVLVGRSLIGSIRPIVAVLDEISKHNLCIPDINIATSDELGQAGAALNLMKGNLSKMVHAITESAEQLAAATEQISMGARQSSVSAHSEAEQAMQAASAMQEMSATVREVAGHAAQASEASIQSAEAARQGGKVAEETLVTMSNIAVSTSNAAARILELGKSSEKIGNIVAVITEIAGQTNLLALNAAIEAARAGEQGRGFAVVAGEVRRLAERTASATQQIARMIETIQTETKVAVDAIEKGNREVELGVKKTNESGRALVQIIGMSENVGSMVARIATAASQQEGASEQINSSVSEISNLTQASSANADQTADACRNLSSLASDLHRLVGEFCVGTAIKPRDFNAVSANRKPANPALETNQPRRVAA